MITILNLNVHSEYSLLFSLIKINEYLQFAINNNLKVLSLTDKNNMYATMEFYNLCGKHNIKPIIGVDIDVVESVDNLIIDSLIVIAKNYQGYQNLCQLTSTINTNTQLIITYEQLSKYLTNDVIVVIKPTNRFLKNVQVFQQYIIKYFLKIDWYLGIIENMNIESTFFQVYIDKIIPCHLVKYFFESDAEALQLLDSIKNQTKLKQTKLSYFQNFHYRKLFVSPFADKTLDNLNNLVNKVNLVITKDLSKKLLKFPLPNKISSVQYLQELCFQMLKILKLETNALYVNRLQYELKIITQMGFCDYFLIVYDYVKFAYQQNIMVGPGRGSVASSLVAYLLNISQVDPIKYNLIFERFLNPERINMPDIDIDFQDDKRELVIQYLVNKYGKEHVAQIITFQTITSKIALKDTARVLGINLVDADKISKAVPVSLNLNLEAAIKSSPILQYYKEQYLQLFILAKKIIGLPRQIGTHAAGIVLSQEPLFNIVPVQKAVSTMYLTQYAMDYLEQLGLLKMDLLGLRTLTIIKQVLQMIKFDLKINIILKDIPLDDRETYQLLSKGDTLGIFQLESPGMQLLLKKMQPQTFDDIVVTSALYRPGPQEYLNLYLERKFQLKPIIYLHSSLKPILEKTYGIIIYQEQILLIAKKVANFSLAKADILRRAIGKKDKVEMETLAQEFITNSVNNGYTLSIAQNIFNDIQQFSNYGFNQSHAVAYSLVSYWMAYLKVHYPLQFMCALLTSVVGAVEKMDQYVKECKRYKIKILPPSVNYSKDYFYVNKKNIQFPLIAVKQVGKMFYVNLEKERQQNGKFTSYSQFVARMLLRGLNTRILEMLINSGALDEFNITRKTMLTNIDIVMRYGKVIQVKKENNIILNFNLTKEPLLKVATENEWEKYNKEQESLGLFLDEHPLFLVRKKYNLENKVIHLKNLENLENKVVLILGIINNIKVIKTKHNDYMCFLEISDDFGSIDVTVFSNWYEKYKLLLKANKVVLVKGKIETYKKRIHLILNHLQEIK